MVLSFSLGSLDPFPLAQVTILGMVAPRPLKLLAISDNQQLDIGASESNVVAQPLERIFAGKSKKGPARVGGQEISRSRALRRKWSWIAEEYVGVSG